MSLVRQIEKEIKVKFPDIYNSHNNLFDKFTAKIYKTNFRKTFGIMLVLVLLVFIYTYYFDFKFLKIITVNFDDNIKTFTTAIITLVSMNLFVTNLLFTHLRDERDDLQSIIDEKVNFKFVTYLGFSLIISILMLYFISHTILNVNIKSNILILIFSAFIIYIFHLVVLYNTVFNFIHKTKRLDIVKTALHSEFCKAFYNDYLKKEFTKKYLDILENKLNFKPYSVFDGSAENLTTISIQKNKILYLNDIDLIGLERNMLKINAERRYYYRLDLNRQYDKNFKINVLSFSEPTTGLQKHYKFSTKKLFSDQYKREELDKLLRKVQINTSNDKFSDLKRNLDDFEDIYSKYIELEHEI